MRSSLEDVPDEIIRHILLYLPPEHTIESFQLVSRRYHHLSNESLLWRWHCRSSFRFWHPEHKLSEKLTTLASSVDWRRLWITRKHRNDKAARLLDGVIATKLGQLKRMQGICEMGYDVKDYLLEQCHVDDDAEDVLARRYESYFYLGLDFESPTMAKPRAGTTQTRHWTAYTGARR
jgi:F-box protein 21